MTPGRHEMTDSTLAITKHAAARMQQRGIDKLTVFLLMEFGRKEYSGTATVRYLDKKRAQRLACRLKSMAQDIERLSQLYLVEEEETLVTVAHGHRHYRR